MHENIVRVEEHHSETETEQDGRCIILILHTREGELSVRERSSNWIGAICVDVVHFTTVEEIRRNVDRDHAFELAAAGDLTQQRCHDGLGNASAQNFRWGDAERRKPRRFRHIEIGRELEQRFGRRRRRAGRRRPSLRYQASGHQRPDDDRHQCRVASCRHRLARAGGCGTAHHGESESSTRSSTAAVRSDPIVAAW
jgi:hypothetical protein